MKCALASYDHGHFHGKAGEAGAVDRLHPEEVWAGGEPLGVEREAEGRPPYAAEHVAVERELGAADVSGAGGLHFYSPGQRVVGRREEECDRVVDVDCAIGGRIEGRVGGEDDSGIARRGARGSIGPGSRDELHFVPARIQTW